MNILVLNVSNHNLIAIYVTIIRSVILITLSPLSTIPSTGEHAPTIDPSTIQKPTIHIIFPSKAKIATAAIGKKKLRMPLPNLSN